MTSIDFADFLQHPDFELLERHIDAIDIGFFGLSADDVAAIKRIENLATKHDKLFVITLGADGSRACCGDRRFDCAAGPVDKIVDTTGAGDAFAAGIPQSPYCHRAKTFRESLISGAEARCDGGPAPRRYLEIIRVGPH